VRPSRTPVHLFSLGADSLAQTELLPEPHCAPAAVLNGSYVGANPAGTTDRTGPIRDRFSSPNQPLVRQAHDKCQSDIQSRDVFVVETTDLFPDSLAPNRNRLVRHHLRSRPQPVFFARINCHPEIWRIAALGSHLTYHNRGMLIREGICLDNHCWAGLTIVAGRGDGHNITAPHRASNSDTDSLHRVASNSRVRSSPVTCLATRRRTARERASGTTKRNSRRPRARRRSRISFIRSAGCAMGVLQRVTRDTVTRYGHRFKQKGLRDTQDISLPRMTAKFWLNRPTLCGLRAGSAAERLVGRSQTCRSISGEVNTFNS